MGGVVRSNVRRLSEDRYEGRVAVAFTLCLATREPHFTSEAAVAPHRRMLEDETLRVGCVAYAYCFMPDHLHVVLLGVRDDARPKAAIVRFKQWSGFLFGRGPVRWQPRFWDHVLRAGEDTAAQVLYVLNNPLRAGLTAEPLAWPFSGAIGMSYAEVLETVIDL